MADERLSGLKVWWAFTAKKSSQREQGFIEGWLGRDLKRLQLLFANDADKSC